MPPRHHHHPRGHHTTTVKPNFENMTLEEKEAYLEQKRQQKIREAQYQEYQHKQKVKKGIIIGIVIAIILGIIIAIIVSNIPAIKAGWSKGQQIASSILKY